MANHGNPPPPPPPPGGFRVGPGPGPGPQVHQQQQPQHHQPQPHQTLQQQQQFQQQQASHNMGFPPSQIPIRSHRISNLQTQRQLDEVECQKELTTYKAYTLQKSAASSSRDTSSWANISIDEERLSQEDLLKAVKTLKAGVKGGKRPKSVAEKKLALAQNQSTQVTNLLDDLVQRERDHNFEWTLTEIDSKVSKKNGVKKTDAMTVYFKRAPIKGVNATSLYQQQVDRQYQREEQDKLKERQRRDREQAQRVEQQFQEQQQRELRMREIQAHALAQAQAQAHVHQQQQQQHNQPRGGPQVVTLNNERGRQGGRGRSSSSSRSRSGGRGRRHREHKKSNRRYESGSDDDSDGSWSDISSNDTSISSRRTRRSDKHHRKDKYSKERATKYHQKKHYNVAEVPRSPRQLMQDRLSSIVEVPPPPIGRTDAMTAAYQAGLHDADAEHYQIERIRADRAERSERQIVARDRDVMYDSIPRYNPPHEEARRTIIESAMPLHRVPPRRASGLEPRGVLSYTTEENYRRPPLPARIYSEGPRYGETRRDSRDVYDEDRMYRQERSAHDYINSSRAEPPLATRTTTYRRSPYEPVLHQENPFAQHRDSRYR